jgi:orotidine-5'-phosphate decarboxylase
MAQNNRIIFALDVGNMDSAKNWVKMLKGHVWWFKVGLELFTAVGPDIVTLIKDNGIRCFLDLKFHDIPNTVAGAVRSAARTGADMMTIHLSGGRAMVKAALKAAQDESIKLKIERPNIVGVSVLTSLSGDDLQEIGIDKSPGEHAAHLARFGSSCGLDGLVCSAEDLPHVRHEVPKTLTLITPGIRPAWSEKGDQKRIATPSSALKAGADLLVIGRPISESTNPIQAVEKIISEIESF